MNTSYPMAILKREFSSEDPAKYIRYLIDGSIGWRIGLRLSNIRKNFRCRYWEQLSQYFTTFEAQVAPGVKMTLYYDDELSRLIVCRGVEFAERQFLRAFLRKGDIFFDVGANIGLFSLLASERLGDKGRVHAFEPSTSTFKRLRENIQVHGFGNVVLHNVALGESESELLLETKPQGREAWRNLTSRGSKQGEVVSVLTLDQFSASLNLLEDQFLFVKLDVEGWEIPAIKGSLETLDKIRNLVFQVEFSDAEARAACFKCSELYRYLRNLGFTLYRYELGSHSMIPAIEKDYYDYENHYAVRDINLVESRINGLSVSS